MDTRSFSRRLATTTASLSTLTKALTRLHAGYLFTARVAFERLGLAYLLPRAGVRRQLLHQGRAPKGRR